jgi:hypothetical protein
MTRPLALIVASLALASPAIAIVGGAQPADEALTRHVVMVVGARSTACSGTPIGRTLVLTAAHCVPPGAQYSVIEPGARRGAKANRATGIERHPQFDPDTALSGRGTVDVALVKLAEPLSARIAPVPLGTRDHFPIGDRFIVAGYGVTIDGHGMGGYGTLRFATLMVVRHAGTGFLRLADPATRGEMAGLGACSGDSGGPVFEDTAGRFTLVGVVSWGTDGRQGGGCGGFTGATPLPLFRTWITETARKLGSTVGP